MVLLQTLGPCSLLVMWNPPYINALCHVTRNQGPWFLDLTMRVQEGQACLKQPPKSARKFTCQPSTSRPKYLHDVHNDPQVLMEGPCIYYAATGPKDTDPMDAPVYAAEDVPAAARFIASGVLSALLAGVLGRRSFKTEHDPKIGAGRSVPCCSR